VGLFSSIGKALKSVGKIAGFIPGVGGIIGKAAQLAGGLLDSGGSNAKRRILAQTGPMRGRGKSIPGYAVQLLSTARATRLSPVMPGGAISTPRGMMTQSGGSVPATYGGMSSAMAPVRRRRKKAAPKKRVAVRRAVRRKSRLKFGSPAWRKKFMKRR
jgi:hypothetical protein